MSDDIFKMIRSNVERDRRSNRNDRSFENFSTQEEEPVAKQMRSEKSSNMSLQEFLFGESERKRKTSNKSSDIDILDEEIGFEKEQKNPMKKIKSLDFVALDKMRDKAQILELRRGYIELLDHLEEITKELTKLQEDYKKRSASLHQVQKENAGAREFLRRIVQLFPDGFNLRKVTDTATWTLNEVESELLSLVQKSIEKNLRLDEYIKEQTGAIQNENGVLKRQLVNLNAEYVRLQQQLANTTEVLHHEQQKNNASSQQTSPSYEPSVSPVTEPSSSFSPQPTPVNESPIKVSFEQPPASSEPIFTPPPVAPEPIPYTPPSFDPVPAYNPSDFSTPSSPSPSNDLNDEQYILLDVDRYVESLLDASKVVIKVIGSTGASRNAELRAFLEEDEEAQKIFSRSGKFNQSEMSTVVKNLKDGGFLESVQVKLGSRGGYNFPVYELNDLGKAVYRNLTGNKPVISEKQLIINQHTTLEHGYLIKDCAKEFSDMGFTVYTKPEDLSIKIAATGKRKEFDLIIEKDGKKQHIEVERGTHTLEDFFDAMDKIHDITNDFYFVAPNEEILYGKTKVQCFKWINERLGGMEKAKGRVIFNFATFEKIKKRGKSIWETIPL